MTKTYSTKSNALRAAKQAGFTPDQVQLFDDGHSIGRKYWFEEIAVAPVAAHRGEVVNKSTTERPCKRVWIIADDMLAANPEVKRKDVIAACIAAGVAFYTARTQYQQWLGVRKEMAAREASKK